MFTKRTAAAAGALAAAVGCAAAGATAPAAASTTSTTSTTRHAARPVPLTAGHISTASLTTPPTTAQCEQLFKIACYSPVQYAQAYDLHRAWNAGFTGRGRTIVLVDSFGSPTIRHDLSTFDATYNLPDPPSLKILTPVGAIPPYDNSAERQNWAGETTLDVEYAHAIAPDANIVLVETPVAETEGVTGFPEIVAAENYVIDHGIGDVISQSFGATEQTFPSRQSLLNLRSAFVNARAHHVTMLAGSGDAGATNFTLSGSSLYPFRVNSWPSSDPLVTSLGGTMLHLDAAGNRTSPDETWNDGFGAGGGGSSLFFARPVFQDPVRAVVGDRRGTPDISMSAAVNGAAIMYYSYDPANVGYHLVGGTSEASPIFAGVVAIAAQIHGSRVGDINPALYALGQSNLRTGIIDVTKGNNTFGGVTGFPATRGYDLATGWGTVNVTDFATALAQQTGQPALTQQALTDR